MVSSRLNCNRRYGCPTLRLEVGDVIYLFCFSTFGSVEVFNLDPNKVHKLQAWVMHDIKGTSRYVILGSRVIVYESVCRRTLRS